MFMRERTKQCYRTGVICVETDVASVVVKRIRVAAHKYIQKYVLMCCLLYDILFFKFSSLVLF